MCRSSEKDQYISDCFDTVLLRSIPDFTRYARKPSDTYIQIIVIPIMFTLIGFFGIVVTSAGAVLCTLTRLHGRSLVN
jgi:cytosine/uracil/thiamine/allantoin permease